MQYACAAAGLPSRTAIRRWVRAALAGRRPQAQLTVRIVSVAEGADLNRRYRQQTGPANVLAFPVIGLEQLAPQRLGDIVLCAPLVVREAREQGKSPEAHWAHLVVHGVLHLLGYDHQKDAEARIMEQSETEILRALGYPAPYAPIET